MAAIDPAVFTPYSSVAPLWTEMPEWVPELDRERLAAYETYEKIYWSFPKAFKISMMGSNDAPIYVPSARTIVDSTSSFLLKGLKLSTGVEGSSPFNDALQAFLKRERFYSRFHMNKQAGVTRGDYIFHMTADENQPEGSRISLTTVDPAAYFPIWDPEDDTKRIGADLVTQIIDPIDNKVRVHRLRYLYEGVPGARKVTREEVILEMDGWYKGKAVETKYKTVRPKITLPDEITSLPVYHFKNIDWQGDDFGSSELRGFERLQLAVNQSISDEELALALDGLGVYATDAPAPKVDGVTVDWEVSPGIVLQIPAGTSMKRVEGVGSVQPMQDHLGFLLDSMYEASATFRSSKIQVQEAESGIALAIKFMPTLAKIEQRDNEGLDRLDNMFYDWKQWHNAFEGSSFGDNDVITPEIGEKLPQNRTAILNELNNMLDRQIISREWYAAEMRKLGYDIPSDMMTKILEEEQLLAEARVFKQMAEQGDPEAEEEQGGGVKSTLPKPGNKSNNKKKPNESGGTEATQTPQQQTKR